MQPIAVKNMDTVRSQVSADVKLVTMEKIVNNVIHILAAKMVIAGDHGNVTASKSVSILSFWIFKKKCYSICRPGFGGMLCDEGK